MSKYQSRSGAKPVENASVPPAAEQKHAHDLRILIILSALMSFASISTDMYLPALPTLVNDFHTDIGRVELTISTFLIGFSLGQLLWGGGERPS